MSIEDYGRWRKADLIARIHDYEASRSVETSVMLFVTGLDALASDDSARAELALSLARRIDNPGTPGNAVPGLSKQLEGLLDRLGRGTSAGDDFDDQLRGAAGL